MESESEIRIDSNLILSKSSRIKRIESESKNGTETNGLESRPNRIQFEGRIANQKIELIPIGSNRIESKTASNGNRNEMKIHIQIEIQIKSEIQSKIEGPIPIQTKSPSALAALSRGAAVSQGCFSGLWRGNGLWWCLNKL